MSSGPLLDPVLLGVLSAAVEEESALAYEAGFSDGLRAAYFRLPPDSASDGPDIDLDIGPDIGPDVDADVDGPGRILVAGRAVEDLLR